MKKKFTVIISVIIIILGISQLSVQPQVLADNLLRLHVIANSDRVFDQELKLRVKDDLVAAMKPIFDGAKDREEAELLAKKQISYLEQVARCSIAEQGYDYPVKVMVGEYMFPTKSYGNLVLPQGNYRAVRVIIGDGAGSNWWCVLFPPLCMVAGSDKGLSLDTPQEAKVSFKCLELLAQSARFTQNKAEPGGKE